MSERRSSTHRRDTVVLGAAIGLVGMTFGVLAVSADLSVAKAMAMSLLVFTGASQFAAIGIADSGGSPVTAVGSALFLAARNSLYGMRMGDRMHGSAARTLLGAQLVIDESTAMSLAQDDDADAHEAFWWMGISVFVFWNIGTLIGAFVGQGLGDPAVWGLDAAFLASFVALMGPQLRTDPGRVAAILGAAVAIAAVPVSPAGAPILLAALAVGPAMLVSPRGGDS